MTINRHPQRRLASGTAPRKGERHAAHSLQRIGLALLAAIVFAAWVAALPALLGHDGLSWRASDCGSPGYRDPVTGQAAHLRTLCHPNAGWRP